MMVEQLTAEPIVLSRRRRIGILLICSMSLLIVGLDVTIVNVALPAIGSHLHSSVSGLQWAVDAYSVVLASFLMLAGATGDRFGRRRVFLIGLSLFTAASLLCSIAPTIGALIAFRMVQGVGASMMNPVALSIVTNTFTDARERAQAIGVWAAVFGISTALGPVVGGVLVDGLGWRSIFWINLPIGILAIALTLRFVPTSRAEHPRRPDPVGQVLVIALLAALTFAIIEAPRRGWGSTVIIGAFALCLASLGALLRWERRRVEPLLDLRFFRSVPFAGAGIIAICAFAAMGGFLFLNTLYLQDVRHLSALRAGLDTLPMAAMVMIWPPISGRIVGTRGARIPLLVAGIGLAGGCAMLTQMSATTPFWYLFLAYAVFGIGFGFVNTPITNAAVSGMPRAQAGVAGAITSSSRQVGQTLGVAVVGVLAAVTSHSAGLTTHSAWWVLTGCGVAVFVLGLVVTSSWARRTAVETAHALNPEYLVVRV